MCGNYGHDPAQVIPDGFDQVTSKIEEKTTASFFRTDEKSLDSPNFDGAHRIALLNIGDHFFCKLDFFHDCTSFSTIAI
jgi:hypothetical protein